MVCCWDIGYGNYIRIMLLLLNVCYFIVIYVKLKDLKIFVIENKLFFFFVLCNLFLLLLIFILS